MIILPLFLNDIGGSEIVLIVLVVLMFFGSKSIPGIAKTLGRTLYEFRNATSELQNEIKKSGFDMKKDLNLDSIIKDTAEPILQPMDQVFTDIENTVHYGATSQETAVKSEISEDELPANEINSVNEISTEIEPITTAEDIREQSKTIVEEPINTKTNEQ